ncbi:GNAT family N-acetyltransferase [Halomontanus rarus]|uniref:GNAT family N-acetyltransferase n=1 Tax=Halomontanus rarus TaxID=3034020 RepID=UPI001A987D64
MTIEIDTIDASEREQWNEYVDQSAAGTFFHRYDVLEVIERHASAELYTLVGYKGQEPVGIFPIFEIRKGGISTAFSPPPGLGLPFLGPAHLNENKLKRRKLEKRRKRFIEGCLEWLNEASGPRYTRICTSTAYDDPRPFSWNDYDTTPLHTYLLDINRDEEQIKSSFSKSLRRYLDPDDDEAARFSIEEGGTDAIRFIHDQIQSRYEAQGRQYRVPLEFLIELFDTLPDGHVRPYVGTVDDERTSGIIIFEGRSTIYYSEGGGKPDIQFPINDLLHWRIIRDAVDRGIETYDLHGAESPRISEYKSKFNPELQTYYELEKGTPLMNVVSNLYKRYNSLG